MCKKLPYIDKALCLLTALAVLICGLIPAAAHAGEDNGVVNAKVVLRKSPNTNSKALQTLPKGEEVELRGATGSWYKVRYGEFSGYILKKYVNASKTSFSSGSSSGSSGSSSKIKELGDPPGAMRIGDKNGDVTKLQKALKILGYYKLGVDGEYGDGTTAAVLLYQKDHKLEADGVAGKATVTSIFGSCNKKSLTTQASASASAVKKASSSSGSGASYKTVSSIAEIGSAPAATKEGSNGSDVVKLQQALEYLGYYSGTIDGDYGEGTVAAVKRLQRKRGMKADGIAGASTIRVIFGSTSASKSTSSSSASTTSYKTEVLDWFADNVTSVIPKNAHFTVKDVKTGKTFECVRWSGINHLDAEPRTSEDTAAMKSIFGGAWSWSRRAILIKYNGHVYAASMNGMPHGTTTISGNNFDGHFCIHFKNSKTHETEKIDADHQSAVNTASNATW